MSTVTGWGAAIITSLTAALALVFAFIPRLLGFIVILVIGWIVAMALEKAVTWLLRRVGFDRIADRIGLTKFEQRMGMRMDASGLLGRIVYWFLILVFLVPAVDALGLTSVSGLLNQIIAYIPNVFVAVIILLLGTLAATIVADIVKGATASSRMGNPDLIANVVRYVIMVLVAIVALDQLQVAPGLMQVLFTAIVGAVALAFGLSFGLGGREAAQRWLARRENTLVAARIQSQGSTSPAAAPSGRTTPTTPATATTNMGTSSVDRNMESVQRDPTPLYNDQDAARGYTQQPTYPQQP